MHMLWFNRSFPSSPRPRYQREVKCSAFDMEMIFHSHANKTHFLTEEMRFKRLCTWPHFESEGFWNSEEAYFIIGLNIISLCLWVW